MADYSPMMQQYFDIKNEHKDHIVFFRLGDFYEMFYDDAKLVSSELDIVLTGRDCGQPERAPMCGVPYHSSDAYIARLIEKGYKIAICEQTSDPSESKGIVNREVVRVITPGTITDTDVLDEKKNNYICSVYINDKSAGLAFSDISTGEIFATEMGGDISEKIINELGRFTPAELVICENILSFKDICFYIKERLAPAVSMRDESDFDFNRALDIVLKKFKISQDEIDHNRNALCAAGALLTYLYETQKNDLGNINSFVFYENNHYMDIDLSSRRNLELTENMRRGDRTGSLLNVIDKTKTAMGGRLIRSYIEKPLVNCSLIIQRLNAVEELCGNFIARKEFSELLGGIFDIERLMSKIVYKTANARDLRSMYEAFNKLPRIKELLSGFSCNLMQEINANTDPLEDISRLIDSSITDEEIPFSVREGAFIKNGYNAEVDEIRLILKKGNSFLADIETREKEKTGIKSLKISHNKIFGYYIEITKSYYDQIPEGYERKQTLANCERFITQELKELESKILNARDNITKLEYDLFIKVLNKITEQIHRIQKTAKNIAALDVMCSFSETAVANNYVRPDVDYSDVISITQGRHPVVEKVLKGAPFVPNDTYLDNKENTLAIITGPNMAGKSTYMRQVAIIVLLAQIGSFVPAKSAAVGIVDKIFTRVGASDDLASGQSTFMVEMNEVANIVKNATNKSLIIFDEIGRGTSTFDGMSIARAVLEFVADKKRLGAKALFATHYHELTELEGLIKNVKNYNVAVKKRGDEIIFLRKIVKGGADDSYGIEVAKLAGVNNIIIERAKEILLDLENGDQPIYKPSDVKQFTEENPQISFEAGKNEQIINRLKKIDINVLTPVEAFNLVYELIRDL